MKNVIGDDISPETIQKCVIHKISVLSLQSWFQNLPKIALCPEVKLIQKCYEFVVVLLHYWGNPAHESMVL